VRAREPDREGFVAREGVRISYEVFGDAPGKTTLLLVPTWSIMRSRFWKAQVPYLARHFRVVTFDGRGTGRSDRPPASHAYTHLEFAADTLAVLDATGTDKAVLVGLSCGTLWNVQVAADHPERVLGIVAIGPAVPLAPLRPERTVHPFDGRLTTHEGWAKYNKQHWLNGGYDDFLRFFFGEMVHEPHSTKQLEDLIGWGREVEPETLVAAHEGLDVCGRESFRSVCQRMKAPVLVIHGDEDKIRPHAQGAELASVTGGRLVTVAGAGHVPIIRDPVLINRLIKEFVDELRGAARTSTWVHAARRGKKVLYVSSPIGLGHAQRDVAIAAELKRLQPDLQVDWLAQHPVTKVLEKAGERIHPASAWLANESAHIESESAEHDLHAFQAIRRMDEILVNNFMVLQDVVEAVHYDLVIGDEAWDVDYFLHENPELKRYAFAWMTDFVGWLPMPDGGAAEAALTADYNAEMIEQRARYERVRDRSIFVGEPDDIVPDAFGPGLPGIREWTEKNFAFAGYVTGFDPAQFGDREALRADLGYRPDERVCLVTVGGSGVGASLLRRVVDAAPIAQRMVAGLKLVVVCGPRIDPESLPKRDGVTYRPFVPQLYRHLAACDLAVVQGGLTTCMELTANRRPFLYVPLRHHFEQNFHVRHRLARYGAGRHLPYEQAADPDALAGAIAAEIDRKVDYRSVATDGAARAARLLAELL
jgi:pimeloyl-ACP methyl ester carboxylesterase/predicted glycosyltransferase